MPSLDSQIDGLILSAVPTSWVKVAFVIGKVDRESRKDLRRDIELDLIAERIEALIQQGRLESQGDVEKWRFSEVRKRENVALE